MRHDGWADDLDLWEMIELEGSGGSTTRNYQLRISSIR